MLCFIFNAWIFKSAVNQLLIYWLIDWLLTYCFNSDLKQVWGRVFAESNMFLNTFYERTTLYNTDDQETHRWLCLHSALTLLQSHPFVDGAYAFFWSAVDKVNIYRMSCLQFHLRNGRKFLLNVFSRTKVNRDRWISSQAGEHPVGSVSCTRFEKHAHLLHRHLLWGSFAEGVSLVFSAVSLIFNFSMRFPRAHGSPF